MANAIGVCVDSLHIPGIVGSVAGDDTVLLVAKNSALAYEIESELIGLCTDICVVSNALLIRANFPEADIYVDAKCCAGVTPESHKAALTTMKMCQINIENE